MTTIVITHKGIESITTNDLVELVRQRKIYEVAAEIRKVWGAKVSPHAKPYLDAMFSLEDKNSKYICDGAIDIVQRFLGNAQGWRGEDAKRIKAELKSIVGVK
jgi:hypothetical protein